MSTEIDALTHFFAAINRNDMEAMVRDFDPQIVRVEPEGFPTAGTYRGIADVREHVRTGRGTWAEGSCDPEKFFVNGEKAVVYLHAWVRPHGAADWMGGRFADGFVFRNGRITEYRTFVERAQALEWAGIRDDASTEASHEITSDNNPVEHPIFRVFREIKRIFGEQPVSSDPAKVFMILPLINEQEALEFLQTVPTGVSVDELSQLALAYRKNHPVSGVDASEDDREPPP